MSEPGGRSLSPCAIFQALALALYAIYAAGFLYRAGGALTYPLGLDFGEGFLLAQGLDLAEGRLPYQPLSPERMVVGNYPLLYPALSSVFLLAGGSPFAGPRAVSIVATLGTALLAYLFLARRGVRPLWSILAALFYLSTFHVFEWGVLARVDALGLFFSALGIYLFDRNGRLWPALVCFTLAFNTRQTLLAGPLAVAVFLWRQEDRAAALRFLAMFLGVQAAIIALLAVLTHGEYCRHLFLYNINRLDWKAPVLYGQHLARMSGVWIALGLAFLAWSLSQRRVDLLVPLLAFSFLSSLTCAKVGAATNYFLELLWVLSLAGGQTLDELSRESEKRPILAPLLAALVLVGALQSFHVPATSWDYLRTPVFSREDRAATGRFIHLIREADASGRRVLASDASFHLLAGVAPFYHPFIMTELAREGRFDDAEFWAQLRDGRVSAVILDYDLARPGASSILFSDQLRLHLNTSYRLTEQYGRFRLWERAAAASSRNPNAGP